MSLVGSIMGVAGLSRTVAPIEVARAGALGRLLIGDVIVGDVGVVINGVPVLRKLLGEGEAKADTRIGRSIESRVEKLGAMLPGTTTTTNSQNKYRAEGHAPTT